MSTIRPLAFRVAIPARYASTRLPGKPLLPLAGEPMLAHVYRRALESGAEAVVIATDDERIAHVAHQLGAPVCMTSPHHASGTDRLAEVVEQLGWDESCIVVNLQGDEPLMPPALIRQTAELLAAYPEAGLATLCTLIQHPGELFDPNVVKVVRDAQGFASYFSRAPIPWQRDYFALHGQTSLPAEVTFYRHLGLYAYRAGVLRRYPQLALAPTEQGESLEQLRALWHGIRIQVAVANCAPPPGVDTAEDLARAEAAYRALQG